MHDPRSANIVIVGDEILAGEVEDRNGPLLLASLARAGTRTLGLRVVGDDRRAVTGAVRSALGHADLAVVSGGIGPTHDDITRIAVADALGVPLVPHPEARSRLERLFGGSGSPEDLAMADLPEGADLLTAPGLAAFAFRAGRAVVFPGVPPLLEALLHAHLALFTGPPRFTRSVPARVREGVLAAPLAALARSCPEVSWGSYPELGPEGWSLRVVLRGEEPEALERAERALRDVLARLDPDP
jgi:molybdenum cofactor synthesis domain-containing protein